MLFQSLLGLYGYALGSSLFVSLERTFPKLHNVHHAEPPKASCAPIPQGATSLWLQLYGLNWPKSWLQTTSNRFFQARHCESFHDSLCRLCFYHNFLPEHHLLTGFLCWLLSGLDHDKSWKNKLARLLHLLGANLSQSVQDGADVSFLQLRGIGQLTCETSLGHNLCRAHFLGLHHLHCLHCSSHFELKDHEVGNKMSVWAKSTIQTTSWPPQKKTCKKKHLSHGLITIQNPNPTFPSLRGLGLRCSAPPLLFWCIHSWKFRAGNDGI